MSKGNVEDAEMNEINSQLDVLRLFNAKVDHLERAGFWKRYENEIPNVIAKMKNIKFEKPDATTKDEEKAFSFIGEIESYLEDFDQDEIDAFVLTYRIFTQANDQLSLVSLARIYESHWMPDEARECFIEARQQLNDYLGAPATVVFGEYPVSVRRIADVIIYGGLAHTNPEKSKVFENWKSSAVAGFIWAEFYAYARFAIRTLQYLKSLNKQLLDGIEKHGFTKSTH